MIEGHSTLEKAQKCGLRNHICSSSEQLFIVRVENTNMFETFGGERFQVALS